MNILVIGGTRGIGRQLVEQALAAGHRVTAFARRPERLPLLPGLVKLRGDVLDAEDVSEAVKGQDAVCWAVGVKTPWEQTELFSRGTERLLRAMERHGVRRLLCVTGIGAGASRGHGGFLYDCVLFPLALASIYTDKDLQEAMIRASGLDWTIVRPAILTNGPMTGRYRAIVDLTGVKAKRISRADVAHFILEELATNRYLREAPVLTY